MSIEKMEFLSAAGLLKDLDRTLEKCVECKCFHIGDAVRESAGSESELSRLDEDNPYKELLKRIVAVDAGKKFSFHETDTREIYGMSLDEIDSGFSEIEKQLSQMNMEISDASEKIRGKQPGSYTARAS